MANTKIEWCERTWSPITGCSPISEGCANCYAARMAKRLAGRYGYPKDNPFKVTFHPDRLEDPLHWKKPCHIFVCSMSDMFHGEVPIQVQTDILGIIEQCPHHTFLILTKRPELAGALRYRTRIISNLWLGVTAENQQRADERIPILLDIPAAKHFVSIEPMLGPVSVGKYLPALSWVICGAETGPGKRPMELDWARLLRDECVASGTPFFFKKDSNGSRLLDGREWNERPPLSGERSR